MDIDQIMGKIITNLEKNGFPENQVTFPKLSLTNFVKKYDFDLEDVLGTLKDDKGLSIKEQDDKILFSKESENIEKNENFDFSNINLDALKNMDPAVLKQQAQEMMKNMNPDQMQDIKKKFDNMSAKEKESIMEMSKNIGL